MKNIIILLLLVLASCKNETTTKTMTAPATVSENESEIGNVSKTANRIDKTVYAMWKDFTESNIEFKADQLPDITTFHNNEYDANRLADLIVNKKKRAGSNLYFWYQ